MKISGKGRVLLATVKGDVHDIGKNIVGVVLGCNNYEVIDLGVMVPCERILETARQEKVDIIGLSGLITPSLDEMVHVAQEMQRLDFSMPLLIGGATTSKAHTAVKIEGQYRNDSVVYVPDASRSVSVVGSLLSATTKPEFAAAVRAEYEEVRARTARRSGRRRLLSLEEANSARTLGAEGDWAGFNAVEPRFIGTRVFKSYPLGELVEYIDWTPFFITWGLSGKYPGIFDDAKVGAAARETYNDAMAMLQQIIDEGLLQAKAVVGFWPAQSLPGNDVVVYQSAPPTKSTAGKALVSLAPPQGGSDGSVTPLATLHFLRQQEVKEGAGVHLSLADFVAPRSSGKMDYLGAFAVTVAGADEALIGDGTKGVASLPSDDDYSAIMLKALADRLAEAFAERLHERVRREFWGYQPSERLSKEELIQEKYQGIRPAPGYPACPDHSEKTTLFALLDAEQAIGVRLTESYAMHPAASVSGLYFSHPQARYFNIGKISREQVADLARRKGVPVTEMERLLSPVLLQ